MTVAAPRQPNRAKGAAAVSAAALAIATAFIATHEGEDLVARVDVLGKGRPVTYCYGETSGNVRVGQRFTHEQCLAALYQSARKHAAEVQSCLDVKVPDATAAAFYDFGYNLGATTFCRSKSSVLRKAQAGDLFGACKAIGLYVYSAGRDCRLKSSKCGGITKRRQDEVALCLRGLR